MPFNFKNKSSFTLIELLIVIGILAILAVVVILVLNPAEFLKQARDSTRISDLQTINKALGLYQADGKSSFGSSSTVYVSIPDSSSTCSNLGLPTPPSGWFYHCVSSSTLRNVDSYGWIPVDFTSVSWGVPLNILPIDPINTTSSGNYYTYVVGGSWHLSAFFESEKYKMGGGNDKTSKDNGSFPELYEIGTNLTLLPVSRDPSLVGYWKFDETSGTNVYDASGKGNNGILSTGTSIPGWTSGKVNGALSFDGTDDYVNVGNKDSLNFNNTFSASVWVKIYGASSSQAIIDKGTGSLIKGYGLFYNLSDNNSFTFVTDGGAGVGKTYLNSNSVSLNVWYYVVIVYNSTNKLMYINGILNTSTLSSINISDPTRNLFIGKHDIDALPNFNGSIDDVRIYNRALSASEISAIYNATK